MVHVKLHALSLILRTLSIQLHTLRDLLLSQFECPLHEVHLKLGYALVLLHRSLASMNVLAGFSLTNVLHLPEVLLGGADNLSVCRCREVSRGMSST